MEYSLEAIVRLSGLSVDTIRYYQSLHLIDSPDRRGRKAVYGDSHLDCLRLIRRAAAQGLPLKVIRELLRKQATIESDRELLAAVEEEIAAPRYTTAEIATLLGVPEKLLRLVEGCGVADFYGRKGGKGRYCEDDLRVARNARKLLDYGFPISKLLALAVKQDRAVRKTVEAAVSLFEQHIHKQTKNDPTAATKAFREIFPIVTSLVTYHFQRRLIGEALKRLRRRGEGETMEIASKAIAEIWAPLRSLED